MFRALTQLRQQAVKNQQPILTGTFQRNFSSNASVLQIWKNADAVCFDVDSTVCNEEGIDELAAVCGVGEEVAAFTKTAMEGTMKFEEALAARLEIMKPSKADIKRLFDSNPPSLTPGIAELVSTLHNKGKKVFLVSGGFRQMINPIADQLDIPHANIYANNLLFDEKTGEYTGFDGEEPTSRSGGKPKVVAALMKEHGFKSLVMIGDGATDMEARPPAAAFIGFGGVVVRPTVKAGADWFIVDFADLIEPLKEL